MGRVCKPTGASRARGGIGRGGSGSLLRWVLLLVPTKAGDNGEGGTVVALPLVYHSTMAFASLVAGISFTNISDCGTPYSCLFRSVCLQPVAVLFLSHSPNPTFQYPILHTSERDSGWGVQSCSTDHSCRSCTVLPATDQCLYCLSSLSQLSPGEGEIGEAVV